MSPRLQELSPSALWRHFHSLTQIPRPSHYESEIQSFMLAFGRELGLESSRDEMGNILIRKPATPGMASTTSVVLQGHLDMVPQANAASSHNFTRDPIETVIDGEWMRARGTTLGADNGIGVAAMMALLSGQNLRHGPLETLFTSSEEVGMEGAFGLSPELLQGRTLINTDSEQDGALFIGCAGGANVTGRFRVERMPLGANWSSRRLAVTGLKGGHSGLDIHRGRGNAIQLLFRILRRELQAGQLRLMALDAGNLRNAIPREAYATIAILQGSEAALQDRLRGWQQCFLAELGRIDPGIRVAIEEAGDIPEQWIGPQAEAHLIHAISACPNGVVRMSDTLPALVESSSNLSVVRSIEGEGIEVQTLVRSSVDSVRDDLCARIESLFTLAAAETLIDGQYPGWRPNPDSTLLQRVRQVYQRRFGKAAEVTAIHAGLECGLIGARYPGMEMISFGPTIRDPHSPDERVHIPSVARFWELLTSTLEQMPPAA